jgi:hypothetical protein
MPAPKVSDEEFIRIWNESNSSGIVAKRIGTADTNVRRRRRSIEERHGIRLATVDYSSRAAYDQSMLVTADRVEVKLKLLNGVIIVAGDQHYWPGSIPVMHRAYCYLSKKIKPFAQIWNGDAFDGSSISRFPSIGWESKPSVQEELEAVQERSKEVLESSPNSKRIWTAGNHDLRFESRIAANSPEYRGVKGIHLKDHIPEWTPAWFVTVNEGLPSHTEIRHREKGGVHAAYNNTKESGVNIVTGHDHVADVKAFDDRRGRRYGIRHGMTADSCRDPQFVNYLEGRKVNWQSALAVLTYRDGVLLQPELALRFDDDSFQFRGEIIKC